LRKKLRRPGEGEEEKETWLHLLVALERPPQPHMNTRTSVFRRLRRLEEKKSRTSHAFIVRGFRINPQIRTCGLSHVILRNHFRIQERRGAEEAMGP
jgi:hypothetical protein